VNFTLIASLSVFGLFVAMLVCSEIGWRIGKRWIAIDPDGLSKGAGAAEAAVLALLGLLLAFTFSGAASRFEARRHLIAEEANAIGTTYLRIDLLPADTQPALRDLFRRYLDIRAVVYRESQDKAGTKAKLAAGAALQNEIWKLAVAASQRPDASPQASMLMLNSLNEMIDITETREMGNRNHPPLIVFFLLGVFSMVGALLTGYGTSVNQLRSWFHIVTFAAILSLTVYVIIDLEYPRLGLIRVDAVDQVLMDLRDAVR
jgi:hypothetical protein